ncbi:MAG: hypothetical protein ICV60_01205 [Pyrinomonadaceae bacterium]|nr:hypothetical protein [Pyrinomonadaceae bacterium]
MRAEEEKVKAANVETISEDEFKRICDDIYSDRFEIYEFNPAASRSEALLWMLMGCLISRLSITDEELQRLSESSAEDTYADVVCKILKERGALFDPRPYVNEVSKE